MYELQESTEAQLKGIMGQIEATRSDDSFFMRVNIMFCLTIYQDFVIFFVVLLVAMICMCLGYALGRRSRGKDFMMGYRKAHDDWKKSMSGNRPA